MARFSIITGLVLALLLPTHVFARSAMVPGNFGAPHRLVVGSKPNQRTVDRNVLLREHRVQKARQEKHRILGIAKFVGL